MTTRVVAMFDEQSGITSQSDAFMLSPGKPVNVLANLESGTPSTGACVQVTLDDPELIEAGTAVWVDSPLGARTSSGAETLLPPLTGVRLVQLVKG